MRRIVHGLVLALMGAVLGVGSAQAAPDQGATVLRSPLSFSIDPLQEELQVDALAASTDPGTQHFGPFASSSGDSGTCGPDWANDEFDRFFTVRQTGPLTYTVYEQFKNGSFQTIQGPSPGACDGGDGYGPGTVAAGLVGTMHGYEIIGVTCVDPAAPCEDPSATCDGGACDTTAGFLAEFFPNGAATVDTWFFHYAGYDGTNEALAVNEWKNASCNRGGNHGDIASVTTPGLSAPVCS